MGSRGWRCWPKWAVECGSSGSAGRPSPSATRSSWWPTKTACPCSGRAEVPMAASDTVIAGVGVEPFVGRSDRSVEELARAALDRALRDGGVDVDDVDLFVFGSRFEHPSLGQRTLLPVCAAGPTILNTENACASGTSALEIATAYVRAGMADVAVAVGAEHPSDLGSSIPLPAFDRLAKVGITHPVRYALEAAKYCAEYGVDTDALAGVTVKNRTHAAKNPIARFQQP